MNIRWRNVWAVGLAFGCLWAGAAPLPSGLQVNATVSLDAANSLDPTGGATQAGTLSLTSGGAGSSSSFSGSPATISPSSLTSGLTETGDGIGASFSMSGSLSASGSVTTDGLFADYLLALANTSATETYVISFRAVAMNSVSASGADAFAFSDLRVQDAALAELFFTDYRIDTLNANDPNVNFTLDSPSNVFEITLLPGQSTSLTALQRQRGGVFEPGAYGASLSAFLSIDNVRVTGGGPGPNPVPAPGTLVLFGAALLMLGATSRRLVR
jgi:hypothetical protein